MMDSSLDEKRKQVKTLTFSYRLCFKNDGYCMWCPFHGYDLLFLWSWLGVSSI